MWNKYGYTRDTQLSTDTIDGPRPTKYTLLCPTIEKTLELCRSYAQNKVQKHHPGEFSGYWWQFRTQQFSRYSARLVEERR